MRTNASLIYNTMYIYRKWCENNIFQLTQETGHVSKMYIYFFHALQPGCWHDNSNACTCVEYIRTHQCILFHHNGISHKIT